MIQTIAELIAIVAVLTGTFFSIVGVMGLHRLPDVYTRLHATGKVGVFGVVLLLIAVIAIIPNEWTRPLLLIVLLMVAGPVSAHAIASAAYRVGIPMKDSHRDDLQRQIHD